MRTSVCVQMLSVWALMILCAGNLSAQAPPIPEDEPDWSSWNHSPGRTGSAQVSDQPVQDDHSADLSPQNSMRALRSVTDEPMMTGPRQNSTYSNRQSALPPIKNGAYGFTGFDRGEPLPQPGGPQGKFWENNPFPNGAQQNGGQHNGAQQNGNGAIHDETSDQLSHQNGPVIFEGSGCDTIEGCDCGGGCSCEGGCNCGCDECSECCDDCDCCCHKHHCLPLCKIHECCPLECEDPDTCHIFDDCCCLKCHETSIYGWIDAGIMGNSRDTADGFNGPVTFPDRNGEGQVNQIYGVIERTAPEDNCGCFVGGRVDLYWGSDFFFSTAAGLDGTSNGNFPRWGEGRDLYGWSMPQLYFETSFDDLKIKWGHFYTILGYEVVPAIGNFFYSHSYTMQYGEPFTHTGVLVQQPMCCDWTIYYGVTNGWDTFSADSRANFIGGVTYKQDDWGSFAAGLHTGEESINGPGAGPFGNRSIGSFVWTRDFTSRVQYVLQYDIAGQARSAVGEETALWWGLDNYLFYKLNCCWTLGTRFEWFRDQDGYRVTGLRPGNAIQGDSFPGNFFEWTLGVNWKPNDNFALRPEIRWDWYNGATPSPGNAGPYNAGQSTTQFLFGLDAIAQF